MRKQFKLLLSAWLSTIAAKLVIGIVFLVSVISLFIFIFSPSYLTRQSFQLLGDRANGVAIMTAELAKAAIVGGDKAALEKILENAVRRHNLEFIVVHDAAGGVCSAYNIIKAEQVKYKSTGAEAKVSDDGLIYMAAISVSDNAREIGRLFVGLSTAKTRADIDRHQSIMGWACALFYILGVVIAIALKKAIVAPINSLIDTLKMLKEGDLSQRSPANSNDEIGLLAGSLNEMVDYWETSQRKWGNLNQDLEQRVSTRTLELEDEINERKRAEEELRLFTAKLERSNRELEDFAFVASHDLQEPLRKVQAFGDRLIAVCGDELSEKGRVYLERMQSAAGRMQTLIKDLLTFSRVTSKAQPFVTVDLGQIAREVMSDMEVSIERLGGRVELGDLPTIEADPLQMRQLLQNLIGNGLKFHKKTEPPVVKVYGSLIQERRRGSNIGGELCHLVIEDNGIGFDEKYSERIFTVFQRLHGRSEYEGTGLGLAVCRKIVERHSGTITAKSQLDQGAKFLITMPVRQNDEGTSQIDISQDQNEDDSHKQGDANKQLPSKGMETSFMVPCP